MADNVTLPATGTGTADVVVATDDVAGVHFQEFKLFESTLGSTTPTGVTANPLQVALPSATITTLTPPAAITGFATEAKQLPDGHTVALSATDNAVLDTIDAAIDAINAKLVTGTDIGDVTINNSTGAAAVNIQDGGNTITVDGTVAVTNAGITSIDGKIPVLGQALAAASIPVILPSATITTLTPPAAITGFATSAKQDTLDTSVNTLLKPASTLAAVTTVGTITNPVAVTNAGITSIDGKITACNTGAVTVTTMPTVTVNPHAVTNAGTFATQATLAAETTKVIGTVNVSSAQTIGVTNATAANCKVEATIAASQTIAVTNAGTFAVQAAISGEGLSTFSSIDLDETEEDIKATAGNIYGWYILNAHTATLYVRFYNATAANTTVGTTAALMTLPIPAGAAANCSFPQGIAFSTALCAAATTGVAANDTGAPGANLLQINVFYK